jgi:predicted dehydrogenase
VLARAGIIGSSGVGTLHADALRRIGVTITGLAAASPEIAQRDAERLGIESVYASAEDLIMSNDIDVVHVCTPNVLHLPLCRTALMAGKHVVAEKPLATSAHDAEELLQLAESACVVHALCHNYRYYPMVQALRALVLGGQLGRVHTVHGTWLAEELLTIDPGHWMFDPRQMGDSLSLADVGIHWWDLVEHVTATTISDVICEIRTVRPRAGRGEDCAVFLMQLNGGAIATGSVCQAAPGHGNTVTLELIGERATAAWDIRSANVLTVRELGGVHRVLERATGPVEALGVGAQLPVGQPEGHAESLLVLLGRVYDRIRKDESVGDYPTFADGVRGLRVLEALTLSASKKSWTAVADPNRRRPARL